jgi:hypothetical protein
MSLAGGSFVFLAVVILFLVGVIIALYTRRGSGIDLHPYRHTWGGAPGSALPCDNYLGSDRTSVTERYVARSWRRRRSAQDPAALAAQLEEARRLRRRQDSEPERAKLVPIRLRLGPSR